MLGYEYGYASAGTQPGAVGSAVRDVANGAQIMIDYRGFRSQVAARQRPRDAAAAHGYRRGPEHSSAALERYLQLCAEDNIQVCQRRQPGELLPRAGGRQMQRPFRKPLIIMTPESLLRHPLAKSKASDYVGERGILHPHPRYPAAACADPGAAVLVRRQGRLRPDRGA
jgi:2-oxoglutarate dehydrogenase E1 component